MRRFGSKSELARIGSCFVVLATGARAWRIQVESSIPVVPAKALGHAHILLGGEAGSHLGAGVLRPSRRALASAPQDEEGLCMPWMIDIILRGGHRPRLEGRTTPMQMLQEVCMPLALSRRRRKTGST